MGDIDPKHFLYGWLGQRKLGIPNYDIKCEVRGGRQRFKCELRVPGFSYGALGNSTSKKDAASNAALDFCQYLVREGKMMRDEIPRISESSFTSWNEGNDTDTFGTTGNLMINGSNLQDSQNLNLPWYNAYNRGQTTHAEYMSQKAEEIEASESVDLKSEIHGGWTMDNSKKALNEYLQKMRQPPVVYNTKIKEYNTVRTMETTANVFVSQLGKGLSGKGSGSNKKVSEAACAMNIVRQMFHLNIMQAYGGPSKKNAVSTLPEIALNIPAELVSRIHNYVRNCGIELNKVDVGVASAEFPVSILPDQKLTQFPECDVGTISNIAWAPPMQNWNPWTSSNIDEPPLSFMNLEQISKKIYEKEGMKTGSVIYEQCMKTRQELPVWQYRDQIVKTVASNRVTLIKGETGCGKSTQVAQYLLDDFIQRGHGGEFNAVVSQPRRISAISLAERISNERGEELGETVGYKVRFDGVSPRPYGSMMFCTVGVLLRMMESGLRGISHVIIDEIHERDVDTDFVLIVLREMICEYKDLRVILMSATIDTELFTNFFKSHPAIGHTPVISMHGRTFPVQAFFLEDILQNLKFMPEEPSRKNKRKEMQDDDEGDEQVDDKGKNLNIIDDPSANQSLRIAMSRLTEKEIPCDVIEAILMDIASRGVDGAILVFLPGWAEIMKVFNRLNEHPEFSKSSLYEILPLHSQLTGVEQRRVFNHYEGKRKIILSTNVAETSITIDDVVYVIDSCKAKERMYTSNNNMIHFATVWASRTNIMQRRGRAGRVRAGYSFHLCSKKRFAALDEHGTAEILRIPLHQIALTIKLLRLGNIGEFLGKALEPPPYDMVVESEAVLQSMGALDKNCELTSLGRMLARLPIEPVLGKVLILGTALGLGPVMCDVSAGMSFSTPFVPREKHHTKLSGIQRTFSGNKFSDHCALVAVTQRYRETVEMGSSHAERDFCEQYSLSNPILKMTNGARRQLVDVLRNQCGFPQELLFDISVNVNGEDRELDLMRSLLVMALYPNVCYFTGKRKVLTIEQSNALINKYSVLTPLNMNDISLASPILVFTEKVRTQCISCKGLSVITALQLLVFGSRKVECIGTDLVLLDDMITVRMNVDAAAAMLALRPCVDAFLVRSCENPESLAVVCSADAELRQILRDISSENFMSEVGPMRDSLLTDSALSTRSVAEWQRGGSDFNQYGFSNGGGKMTTPPQNPHRAPNPYNTTMGYASFIENERGDYNSRGGNGRGFGVTRGGRGYRGVRGRGRGWNASYW